VPAAWARRKGVVAYMYGGATRADAFVIIEMNAHT
jgi:hypothetical protein